MTSSLPPQVAALTPTQRARLTGGDGMWHAAGIEEAGIGRLKMSDGPVGARGERTTGTTSTSFPCGSALGATWHRGLLRRVGVALGEEAKAKGAHILLGPTVNLHRHPLAGRNFECYSEDPVLTAELAVAYVEGVQSTGVGACIKHFVANEQENRAEVGERRGRRAHAAGAAARAVRGRRPPRPGGGRDVGVQQGQRRRLQRAPMATDRAPPRRVGVRRDRHLRLVRHVQPGLDRRRTRSRDARSARSSRRPSGRSGRRGRGGPGRRRPCRRADASCPSSLGRWRQAGAGRASRTRPRPRGSRPGGCRPFHRGAGEQRRAAARREHARPRRRHRTERGQPGIAGRRQRPREPPSHSDAAASTRRAVVRLDRARPRTRL